MTGIILAAGFSKRFGKEKLLMEINHQPMFLNVADTVLSMGFEENILVYSNGAVKAAIGNRNIKCIFNPLAAEGQSTSVRCGIRASKQTDAYVFFAGDQPFVSHDTVETLVSAFREGKGSIIVPRYAGNNGNPVIFSAAWKSELENISGDKGGRTIISANPDKVYYVDIPDQKSGMDIDTWEQYTLYADKI